MNKVIIAGVETVESLESAYARAFRHSGWQVDFWNPVRSFSGVARGRRFGRILGAFVNIDPWWQKANLRLLQLARRLQPELLLVIWPRGVRAGTLGQLRTLSPRTRLYCLFPDSPHNLDVERIQCLPLFDRITVSSPAWVDAMKKLGARRVDYLPFAADTILFQSPVASETNQQFACDLSFIGSWREERELMLERLADFDLRIWGNDYWRTRVRSGSPLTKKWGGRSLLGEEFAAACRQSKIALNLLDTISWPGPNMRAFELPACYAFVLAERTDSLLELFTEGKTIECFGSIEEARDKVAYYISHDSVRARIAVASHEFVVSKGHTYLDRVQQLVTWAKHDQVSVQVGN